MDLQKKIKRMIGVSAHNTTLFNNTSNKEGVTTIGCPGVKHFGVCEN